MEGVDDRERPATTYVVCVTDWYIFSRIAARARFARDEEETMAKASVAGVQLQDAGRQLVHLSRHVDVRRCCEWLD